MKIGVFDSGKGGAAVAQHLSTAFVDDDVMFVDDRSNVPYGSRTADEVQALTRKAITPLIDAGCNPIVIACNTATALAIDALREAFPDTNFVGIEPMVKPAAQHSRTKKIAVLATPATLKSHRYAQLKKRWADDCEVIEPDCSAWAALIENGAERDVPIESVIADLLKASVDGIVLGCTHYHWIRDRARNSAGNFATVYEPSQAIEMRISEIRSKAAERQQ